MAATVSVKTVRISRIPLLLISVLNNRTIGTSGGCPQAFHVDSDTQVQRACQSNDVGSSVNVQRLSHIEILPCNLCFRLTLLSLSVFKYWHFLGYYDLMGFMFLVYNSILNKTTVIR